MLLYLHVLEAVADHHFFDACLPMFTTTLFAAARVLHMMANICKSTTLHSFLAEVVLLHVCMLYTYCWL